MEACFLRNRIFINSLLSFHKEKKITEHLFNDNTYDKALIQNIQFKSKNTESTETRKTSFQKNS